jgi:hypothetical protein
VWFGELSPAEQAVVAAGGAGAAGGAAYTLGGDRVQTPVNMAQRYARSWAKRKLRGTSRARILGMLRRRRQRLSWQAIRRWLLGLRKYATRSYWRTWVADHRHLATRKGLRTEIEDRLRAVRKRKWRGWLRGNLRAQVGSIAGGIAPVGLIGEVLLPALRVAVDELQRWVEDQLFDRIDRLKRRFGRLRAQLDELARAVRSEGPSALLPVLYALGDRIRAWAERVRDPALWALVLAHIRVVGAAVIVAIVERIVMLWGHEPVGLDELLAEGDAERLAAAQITTAAQLEAVGDADLQRVLGVDAATVEGWRAAVVTAR